METSLPEAVARRLFGDKTPSHEGYLEALDELQARWDMIERAQFESWRQALQGRFVGRHWWVRGTGSAAVTEDWWNGTYVGAVWLRMTATHCRHEGRSDDAATMARTQPMRKIRSPEGLTYLDRALYENNRLGRGKAIRGEHRIVLIWESTPKELAKINDMNRSMYREFQQDKRGAKAPKPYRYSLKILSFYIATGYPAAELSIKGYDETSMQWSQSGYMAVDWDKAGYRAALGDE